MSGLALQPLPPASQLYISDETPMGAALVPGGATFRVWAPAALDVQVVIRGGARERLQRREGGFWTGFIPGVSDGTGYRFWIEGAGSSGFKRDPWARELEVEGFPNCDCIARDPATYPWHDAGFRPAPFHEAVIYQLHVGAFHGATEQGRVAKFLDVVARVPYIASLGVTTVQLLPVQEFPYSNSLGYNNVDFFSPEMAYQIEDTPELDGYLAEVNSLLASKGQTALKREQLLPGPNQLKALVDLLHLHGIGVVFDLVYNHAGGFDGDDQCLYFFDRRRPGSNNDSLYFIDKGWAGGLIFAYWNAGVREFLIRNGAFFLTEFHGDGIRFDEASVIDSHGGWSFCQDMTSTLRYIKPEALQIAEYWNPTRELAVVRPPGGMGFDAALADGLRDALRGALEAANDGAGAYADLDRVRDALYPPSGFGDSWRAVQCLENHDIVYSNREPHEWKPRIAWLADPSDPRSWYGRSRARFATSILLTAPGIPMLFMGEEVLEERNWNDSPEWHRDTLIRWDLAETDPVRRGFLGCVRALARLRRDYAALSGPNVNCFHVNNAARVIAFHRWIDGQDVVVVGTLSESNLYGYELGFPQWGGWREVFNSDFFDGGTITGNGGAINATGGSMHGLPASARITIPANGVVVFVR